MMDKQELNKVKQQLRDLFKEKEKFCIEQAKDHALESIVGKNNNSEDNKSYASSYYGKAKIWEEAASIITSFQFKE